MKLSRKWAYMKKGVAPNKAIILSCTENFHGRTIGVISMSTDEECRDGFGPFLERVGPRCPKAKGANGKAAEIRYNNISDLEAALNAHGKEVAAFLVEPIQGEAGCASTTTLSKLLSLTSSAALLFRMQIILRKCKRCAESTMCVLVLCLDACSLLSDNT